MDKPQAKVLIMLRKGTNLNEAYETLQDLGLYDCKTLKRINVIIGSVHPTMIETLTKVRGVDYIEVSGTKKAFKRKGSPQPPLYIE